MFILINIFCHPEANGNQEAIVSFKKISSVYPRKKPLCGTNVLSWSLPKVGLRDLAHPCTKIIAIILFKYKV